MLTPQGPKAIETFQVGDEILTRLEWEPDAPVLVSQVEARFENVARIWHLHLASGQVIRTTAEHPFYVDGRGWVPADELRPGDLLVSHDGQRVAVAELYDTGQYERVYNLAIRSFHTYFVCDESWPFSIWAHNAYRIAPDPDAKGPHTVIRRNPQTGQTIRYATYIPQTNPRNPAKWQLVKRVDLMGRAHYNKVLDKVIPTPHVHDPRFPSGVRPALPEELPSR